MFNIILPVGKGKLLCPQDVEEAAVKATGNVSAWPQVPLKTLTMDLCKRSKPRKGERGSPQRRREASVEEDGLNVAANLSVGVRPHAQPWDGARRRARWTMQLKCFLSLQTRRRLVRKKIRQ